MGDKFIQGKLCIKSDTETGWGNSDLVLADGELTLNKTTGELRFGDGYDNYKNSPIVKTKPLKHSSSSSEFGAATNSIYGHVKMSGNGNAETDTVLTCKSNQYVSDFNSNELLDSGIYPIEINHNSMNCPCGCLKQYDNNIKGILTSITDTSASTRQTVTFPSIGLSFDRFINNSQFGAWIPQNILNGLSEKLSYFPILTILPSLSKNEWKYYNNQYSTNIQLNFSSLSLLLYKGDYYTYESNNTEYYQNESNNLLDITGHCNNSILKYRINLTTHTFTPIFYPTDYQIDEVRQTVIPHTYTSGNMVYLELPCMYLRKIETNKASGIGKAIEFSYLTDMYMTNNTIKIATSGTNLGLWVYYGKSSQSEINNADIILSVDYEHHATDNYNSLQNFIECTHQSYLSEFSDNLGDNEFKYPNLEFFSGNHFLSSNNLTEYTLKAANITGQGESNTTLDLGSAKLGVNAESIKDIYIYHHPVTAGITAYITKFINNTTIYAITSSNDYKIFELRNKAIMDSCNISCDHGCGEGLPTGLINSSAFTGSKIVNCILFGTRTSISNSCIITGNQGALITVPTGVSKCIVANNTNTTVTNASTGSNMINNNIS